MIDDARVLAAVDGKAALARSVIDFVNGHPELGHEEHICASHLVEALGPDCDQRYWAIFEELRRDREGARRMGMSFVWIAPAEVQQAEAAKAPLDHPVVTSFGELAEILT